MPTIHIRAPASPTGFFDPTPEWNVVRIRDPSGLDPGRLRAPTRANDRPAARRSPSRRTWSGTGAAAGRRLKAKRAGRVVLRGGNVPSVLQFEYVEVLVGVDLKHAPSSSRCAVSDDRATVPLVCASRPVRATNLRHAPVAVPLAGAATWYDRGAFVAQRGVG
jgi:hypothetical protein